MKILNLVYPENSDIKYQIQKFPDGQQNVVLAKFEFKGLWGMVEGCRPNRCSYFTPSKSVLIKSRLNNWSDLELIVAAVASLRGLGAEEIHLYAPYILGARSDRKFEEGGNNYLKDVICPIINLLNFKTVTCIDPHSDVLEACIKGFRKKSNLQLVEWTLNEIQGGGHEVYKHNFDNILLVSPDSGASKKIYKIAEQIGYTGDIITCSKERDVNGELTKCVVPLRLGEDFSVDGGILSRYWDDKDFIIIDDICDGGATFINIAKEIKAYFHESGKTESKIYLIVTHGIFSKGLEVLFEYFDGIYCTNSYDQFTIDTEDPLNQRFKQLNVF